MSYYSIYNTSNDNVYILILIIIILSLIIVNFKLWKKKSDSFFDINNILTTTLPNTLPNTLSNTLPQTTKGNLLNPNFKITKEEQDRRNAWVQLDGDEESLSNTNGTTRTYQNDITYNSSLLNNTTSNSSIQAMNYSKLGDYATLDSLGAKLTDTLGGIKSNLGYTILDEQLGTFNKYNTTNTTPNQNTYDNTANYKTGMNPSTVNGVSNSKKSSSSSVTGSDLDGKYNQDNKPVFLQKDFQGVANIFAPNIIISNPPLTEDGNPDISFQI